MNNFVRFARARRAAMSAGFAGVASLPALVHAEVPAAVTTALGDAKTDGLVIAGLVLVAIIALFAFKLMRKGL